MRSTRRRGGPLDDLLSTLADGDGRAVLRYFRSSANDVATVDDVAERLYARGGRTAPREEIVVRLHHSTLPKLDDRGYVDYDARSGTVRYRRHAGVERLLTIVGELEVDA